jgi:hypothetical protein
MADKKTFCVKIEYEDDIKRVPGTKVEEPSPGLLVVYEGDDVAARFNRVERWWPEANED